eukprot:m.163297 g.163297  ORF g.163297 m.163297 type:complete len:615 (-) comp17686_c0_seq4:28-1872(-)
MAMWPWRLAVRMCSVTRRVNSMGPKKLTSSTCRSTPSTVSRADDLLDTPAQWMSMSTGIANNSAASMAFDLRDAVSVRSITKTLESGHSTATRPSSKPRLAERITRAPRCDAARATAAPIPSLAPVTQTTLPWKKALRLAAAPGSREATVVRSGATRDTTAWHTSATATTNAANILASQSWGQPFPDRFSGPTRFMKSHKRQITTTAKNKVAGSRGRPSQHQPLGWLLPTHPGKHFGFICGYSFSSSKGVTETLDSIRHSQRSAIPAGTMAKSDFRSDTVTRPTAAMKEAMFQAETGDDVFGDDPTITALQDKLAALLGKEAALFVPSGTMSNAVALRTHTRPGDEIVVEAESHIYFYEGGGYAALCGCSIALVKGEHGIMSASDVAKSIRKAEGSLSHYPNCTLVCIEQTANRGGGTYYSKEQIDEICRVAHDNGCAVHLDGARIFNAVVEMDVDVKTMLENVDTVSICLSKGLGCPVGSVLVGPADFIHRAHRSRKLFGGGLRQGGFLAAAGIYALDHHVDRLAEDNARARHIGQVLGALPGATVSPVMTNMAYVTVDSRFGSATDLVAKLEETGILTVATGPNTVRITCHLDVGDDDVDRLLEAFKQLLKE